MARHILKNLNENNCDTLAEYALVKKLEMSTAVYAAVRGRAARVPRKILPSFAAQCGLRTPDS